MRSEAEAALAAVGLTRDPDEPVRRLIVAEKQLVEIAKALSRKARFLIMDEPTATLTPSEVSRLFGLIERMKAQGVTIVYISHKLDEVERITDEVVVMRDGRLVGRAPTASLTRHDMATMMVGREIADLFPDKVEPQAAAAPALQVEGFTVPGWAQDVSFAVRPGEILGFAGLVGAGRTELFEGIMGLRPGSGTIRLGGRPAALRSPRDAARNGLTYLSEDRKGKGLHTAFPLRPNLTLMALERYARPWLDQGAEREALKGAVAEFGIRTGSLEARAASLSGGNHGQAPGRGSCLAPRAARVGANPPAARGSPRRDLLGRSASPIASRCAGLRARPRACCGRPRGRAGFRASRPPELPLVLAGGVSGPT
ncbi:Ribose import ATP-binding protein RbsA [Bosea thiooxidans]